MKVTRVMFTHIANNKEGYLATCNVVLDDSLMLNGIMLFSKKDTEGFNLVFPSKQDIYREIHNLNRDVNILYPMNGKGKVFTSGSRSFEEFYHPVSKDLYIALLKAVSDAYNSCVSYDKENVDIG